MPRDSKAFLDNILSAIGKIRKYTSNINNIQDLVDDEKTWDAVIRNLEVIGEAVKRLPEELTSQNDDINWRSIAGLRDILIHRYFGVSDKIIWDIIENELPLLESKIRDIRPDD